VTLWALFLFLREPPCVASLTGLFFSADDRRPPSATTPSTMHFSEPYHPVHAQRVTPSQLVLEAKTSLHLGHQLTGGSRITAMALGAVTAQSACQARRAGLGWPGHSGRGLGHPSRPPRLFWPSALSGPSARERRGLGSDSAHVQVFFFNTFSNFVLFSIFTEIRPSFQN
jgi:hypothetical protein